MTEADDPLIQTISLCDEALRSAKLTAVERVAVTARRKAAYLARHPETGHGGDRSSRQLGDLDSADRFTKETADKTGQSERSIQRNVERGEKITPAALIMVRRTALDTEEFLDRLKLLSPGNQQHHIRHVARIKLILRENNSPILAKLREIVGVDIPGIDTCGDDTP